MRGKRTLLSKMLETAIDWCGGIAVFTPFLAGYRNESIAIRRRLMTSRESRYRFPVRRSRCPIFRGKHQRSRTTGYIVLDTRKPTTLNLPPGLSLQRHADRQPCRVGSKRSVAHHFLHNRPYSSSYPFIKISGFLTSPIWVIPSKRNIPMKG